jgi:hypothetical protein
MRTYLLASGPVSAPVSICAKITDLNLPLPAGAGAIFEPSTPSK